MLGRLTSTSRSGGCCLAAFLMGWAVTAPAEVSPADGDGPSPAWTVHPPGSVAPFAPGSSLAPPAFDATCLSWTRRYPDTSIFEIDSGLAADSSKKTGPRTYCLRGAGGVPSALPGVI